MNEPKEIATLREIVLGDPEQRFPIITTTGKGTWTQKRQVKGAASQIAAPIWRRQKGYEKKCLKYLIPCSLVHDTM